MEDKFKMTLEDNILFAKRNLVDSIWKSANLEGIGMTFPDTYVVCKGMSVEGYSIDEINAVNDLKKGWEFLLDTISDNLDLGYIKKLHRIVGKNTVINAGSLKLEETGVGGTDWISPIPNASEIEEKISEILKIKSNTDRAITLMLFCMRSQMFYDGNKRISTLVGNKELIRTGSGIISIPIKKQSEFIKQLIEFYETNDYTVIKKFIYDNCIEGLSLGEV
ncbi:MAG: Fic family protein [Lachnospirales bacterium]